MPVSPVVANPDDAENAFSPYQKKSEGPTPQTERTITKESINLGAVPPGTARTDTPTSEFRGTRSPSSPSGPAPSGNGFPPPTSPTSRKTTASLRRILNSRSLVPVIVLVKSGLANSVLARAAGTGMVPRQIVNVAGLEMVSFLSPVTAVDELEGLDEVVRIFYDKPFGTQLMGGRVMERARSLLGVGESGVPVGYLRGRLQGRGTKPRPGWRSSSEVRKVLGADRAFAQGHTGAGTFVTVIDTGVWVGHRAFRQNPSMPYSVHRGNRLLESSGHGTWVTAQVGGGAVTYENGLQSEGVSRARLATIKALETPLGFGLNSDILKAMELAASLGAKVISMSLGGEATEKEADDPTCIALNRLTDKGHIFVVAAGNSGPNPGTVGSPGIASKALTVGSVSITDNYAPSWFSSRGPTPDGLVKPDVACPGGGRAQQDAKPGELLYGPASIGGSLDMTDYLRNGAACLQGTSMAAPSVAGLVAIWNDLYQKTKGREIQRADIERIIRKRGGAKSNDTGHGLIQYEWVFEEGA